MNDIIENILLTECTFMPEWCLRQPGFSYSSCETFTNYRERIQNLKGKGDWKYIYKSKLDKFCFVHDPAYADSKDLAKKTVSEISSATVIGLIKLHLTLDMFDMKEDYQVWWISFLIRK